METIDRRKYPRVQIFDPISYLCKGSGGDIIEQSVAVVRNVSQTGIQLESFLRIKSKYLSLMFFDLDKNQIEVKGAVVYCEEKDSGQFIVGVNLEGKTEEKLDFVKALIKSYHYQKEKSRLVISPGI